MSVKRRAYRIRLAIERWLWSGGRLRTAFAKRLPLAICDVDGAYYKRKMRRDPEWLESLHWVASRPKDAPQVHTWATGTTTTKTWPWGDDA